MCQPSAGGNGNKLNAVYYSCLMFIEWYNENILK